MRAKTPREIDRLTVSQGGAVGARAAGRPFSIPGSHHTDRSPIEKPFKGQLFQWAIYLADDQSASVAVASRRELFKNERLSHLPLRATSSLVSIAMTEGWVETQNSVYELVGAGFAAIVPAEACTQSNLFAVHCDELVQRLSLQIGPDA